MDVLWNFLRMGGRSRAAPAVAITGVGFEFGVVSPGTIGASPEGGRGESVELSGNRRDSGAESRGPRLNLSCRSDGPAAGAAAPGDSNPSDSSAPGLSVHGRSETIHRYCDQNRSGAGDGLGTLHSGAIDAAVHVIGAFAGHIGKGGFRQAASRGRQASAFATRRLAAERLCRGSGWDFRNVARVLTVGFVLTLVGLSATPAQAQTTLTATLEERAPVKKDAYGRRRHSFDLRLSEPIFKPAWNMRNSVFTVTNGTITKARRIHRERRYDSNAGRSRTFSEHWRLQALPTNPSNAVTVSMTANQTCSSAGALCTPDDTKLSNAPSLTFDALGSDFPEVSIANATANENDTYLSFTLTLSKPTRHVVVIDFETISGGTATEGTDYRAQGYRVNFPYGETSVEVHVVLIADTVNDVGETVKVKISNADLLDHNLNFIQVLTITTAEATGTINAPSTSSTTNVPGLTIGIQDATGDEDSGWLDFRVKLSRKSDDLVCYDFETISGGTATEGTDYLKVPKATYWMQSGKQVDKPFVRLIDDSVNDNGETVKVKISNAHLCDDASRTVSITRDEATGTIRNTDPMMIADYPVGKIAEYPADKDGEAFSATPRDAANASFEQPSAAADVAVTDTGGETTPVTDTGGGTTPVTDTGGETTPVTPPAAVPAPTGLEATEGANGIILNWSAPAATTDTVDGYIVNRCEGAGCIPGYYYRVPSGTTYTDRAVMANTLYRYSVSAHFSSSDKTSDWSNVIERTMGIVEAGLNYRDQVQIMYAAYYGRPGDAGGLDFWATELEKVNGNLSRIIHSFGKSEEFQDRFGDLDDEELVNNSYLQLLGRDADSGGLKFYVNGLREGRFTLASIALNVANGTQNLDEIIKTNKLRAANAFTEASVEAGAAYGEFQIDDAKLWLAGVDSTSASITAALDSLPDLLEIFPEAMPPAPAEPVLERSFIENINILKSSIRISPGTRVAGNSRPRAAVERPWPGPPSDTPM